MSKSDPPRSDPRHKEQSDLKTRRRLERPPLYRVVFHNDDYTTRDFVVMVLMRYFHKSHSEASTLMLHIHTKGKGIAGIYPYDIARSKQQQVEGLARQYEMPLKLTVEPEDGGRQEDE
ncbi:MAG: ATP-dependent Clp protease adaptor ClpS [Myxococcales bacterium]|nr:ATP-dependent Clp protease adaptor ClpS [Myxococcales bacterium]